MGTSSSERAASARQVGRVFLVGAGPGDPDLLTVKALRLLAQADLVLHDALVDPRIHECAPRARRVDVGKRAGRGATAQRFINRLLVSSARHHACVVRLKGGDPAVFGRLDEELQALRAAAIPFEVVPGVTAASAAAASLGVSLTLRGVARGVSFATPRVGAGEPGPGQVSNQSDTLVLYMAGQVLGEVASRLLSDGRPGRTPLVVVENASLPNEHRWIGTLDTAVDWPGPAVRGPVLVLIGDALAAADQVLAAGLARNAA
jgi:uroporphyrin-III C-methyltransferase